MCMKYYSLHRARGSALFWTSQEQVEKNAEWMTKWQAWNEPNPPAPAHPCFLTERLSQNLRSAVRPGNCHIKNNIKQKSGLTGVQPNDTKFILINTIFKFPEYSEFKE